VTFCHALGQKTPPLLAFKPCLFFSPPLFPAKFLVVGFLNNLRLPPRLNQIPMCGSSFSVLSFVQVSWVPTKFFFPPPFSFGLSMPILVRDCGAFIPVLERQPSELQDKPSLLFNFVGAHPRS